MRSFQFYFNSVKKRSIVYWMIRWVSRNALSAKRRSCERNAHLLSKNKGDGVRDVGKSNTDEHTNLEKEKDNLLAMITLGRLTMTPESKVKRKVYEILKKYNVYYFSPIMSGYGKSGVPDVIACYKGVFIGIECKATEKNKPTDLQQRNLDDIKMKGGWALVIHKDNLQELITLLDNL